MPISPQDEKGLSAALFNKFKSKSKKKPDGADEEIDEGEEGEGADKKAARGRRKNKPPRRKSSGGDEDDDDDGAPARTEGNNYTPQIFR